MGVAGRGSTPSLTHTLPEPLSLRLGPWPHLHTQTPNWKDKPKNKQAHTTAPTQVCMGRTRSWGSRSQGPKSLAGGTASTQCVLSNPLLTLLQDSSLTRHPGKQGQLGQHSSCSSLGRKLPITLCPRDVRRSPQLGKQDRLCRILFRPQSLDTRLSSGIQTRGEYRARNTIEPGQTLPYSVNKPLRAVWGTLDESLPLMALAVPICSQRAYWDLSILTMPQVASVSASPVTVISTSVFAHLEIKKAPCLPDLDGDFQGV